MNDPDPIALLFRQVGRWLVCSQCQRKFRPRDLALVEAYATGWVVRMDCAMCRSRYLLAAELEREDLRIAPLDVTPDEWPRFRHRPPISVDDVVEITRNMQAYRGDLSEILEDPLPEDSDS